MAKEKTIRNRKTGPKAASKAARSTATTPKFKIKKGHNDSLKETEKHMQAIATIKNHNL